MKNILLELGFSIEEIEKILIEYSSLRECDFFRVYSLLLRYNCSKEYIREVVINKKEIFEYDIDRLEYIMDAIRSNGDIIEEKLLELV